MRLIYTTTRAEVRVGDLVEVRGVPATVREIRLPWRDHAAPGVLLNFQGDRDWLHDPLDIGAEWV